MTCELKHNIIAYQSLELTEIRIVYFVVLTPAMHLLS